MLCFYYGLMCSNLMELSHVAYMKLINQYKVKNMIPVCVDNDSIDSGTGSIDNENEKNEDE